MKISRRRALLAIVSLPAIPSIAHACECGPNSGGTLDAAAARATSIVAATLLGGGGWIVGAGQQAMAVEPYQWAILRSWKGPLRPRDRLETRSGPGDCVVPNLQRGDWLLFLDGPGPHELSVCSRQMQISKAADVLSFLDKRYGTPR